MTVGVGLQTRFVRAVEAEYDRRVALYRTTGLSDAASHERALEEVKELGRRTLDELRRRGLFPWSAVESEEDQHVE
jgi:hypothetical protein